VLTYPAVKFFVNAPERILGEECPKVGFANVVKSTWQMPSNKFEEGSGLLWRCGFLNVVCQRHLT